MGKRNTHGMLTCQPPVVTPSPCSTHMGMVCLPLNGGITRMDRSRCTAWVGETAPPFTSTRAPQAFNFLNRRLVSMPRRLLLSMGARTLAHATTGHRRPKTTAVATTVVSGLDPLAWNFNEVATVDDGSCVYFVPSCTISSVRTPGWPWRRGCLRRQTRCRMNLGCLEMEPWWPTCRK